MNACAPSASLARTVLVVDDDPIQLRLVRIQLEQAGFAVEAVDSAASAIERARRGLPDLFLVDVLMRDLDGFTLCRTLRSAVALGDRPIVLMSSQFHDASDRRLAATVGAIGPIERTPDLGLVIRAVSDALAGRADPGPAEPAEPQLYERCMSSHLAELSQRADATERRYRTLFEHAHDLVVAVALDGTIIDANRSWERLLQVTRAEMIGRHIRAFAAPGFAGEAARLFAAAVQNGGTESCLLPLRGRDAKIVHVEFSANVVDFDGTQQLLAIGRDVSEALAVRRQLEASAAQYRSLVENMPDVVWTATREGRPTFVSSNVLAITGFPAARLLNESLGRERIHPDDARSVKAAFRALLAERTPVNVEFRWQSSNGRWLWLHTRAALVLGANGQLVIEGMSSDITERRSLQEQVFQAQKLDAVGHLTGGIAHDFNNILAAVLANAHFLMEDFAVDDPHRSDVADIKRAAERGAALTKQLLAFSRRQVLEPTVLDLNGVVAGVERLMRRVLGEDIEFTVCPDTALGRVYADAGQLEQVLMNLLVNARDAMPAGGRLSVSTANVTVDRATAAARVPMVPGRYVVLTVRDTGCGMDAETARRAFEPFFTTKEKGRGTGLGLSTCYGIIKQSGGFIWLNSKPGHGTACELFLPRVDAAPVASVPAPKSCGATGAETILVVEDDARVRAALTRMLERLRYRVLSAGDLTEAKAAFAGAEPVHAVLSDVILPGGTGPELVRGLRADQPALRVLFMSGYVDQALERTGVLESGAQFIAKPFTPEALASKLRMVLDS